MKLQHKLPFIAADQLHQIVSEFENEHQRLVRYIVLGINAITLHSLLWGNTVKRNLTSAEVENGIFGKTEAGVLIVVDRNHPDEYVSLLDAQKETACHVYFNFSVSYESCLAHYYREISIKKREILSIEHVCECLAYHNLQRMGDKINGS